MGLLSGLLENPLVPWAVVLVALLLLYRYLAPRVHVRVPGLGISAEDVVGRLLGPRWAAHKLEQRVLQLKKQGNHLAAGKLLEDEGQLEPAAEAYIEGQEYWAAAATYEKLSRTERAAELFLQAGDYKKSAALFEKAGKPARAAQLFLEKGNKLEAAKLFSQAAQWAAAADLYEKGGFPLRAAEAWEKDGKPLKAAEAYEKHFMENVSYATTYAATAAPSADQKSALLAGQQFEKAGQLDRAISVYEKGSYYRQAAEALLRARRPGKAAELFLRCEDNERAAAALEQAGDPVRAAMLRGEAAFKADRQADAAAWFVKGRDFLRAAELFESIGMSAEAGQAFEQGESWSAAGNVFLRAGLKERAAAAFEKAGELETAASIYEQLGDGRRAGDLYGRAGFAFKSGQAAALAGDHEQAIALLQRVHAGDESYRPATELLARLFIETGRPAVAEERLRKVIAGEAISSNNLDLYYWLALAHEASGAFPEALATYKQIQAEDLQFRDVAERAGRLASGNPPRIVAAPATVSAAAPPPAAAAPPPATAAAASVSPAAGATPRAPAPAQRQPRFVPKEEIGPAVIGALRRGEDQADGRSVAMRLIPKTLLTAPGLLPALAADLKAAAQISHPNVVKVIAFMEWKGERCVVTEYVPGRNFAEAIASGRRLAFQQVHALARIAAQVLALLHENRLVHGSIQPSNVMVANGVIKVADLGLGRLAQTRSANPSYHAPEGGLSPADDLYALAAVVYHLLTGVHPRSQAQGVGLPLPSQLAPGVPEPMDRLLLRSLHPRPELRVASAPAFLEELRGMVRIG